MRFINTKREYQAEEIGTLKMDMIPKKELRTGDVGYIVTGIKNATEVKVGDTLSTFNWPVPVRLVISVAAAYASLKMERTLEDSCAGADHYFATFDFDAEGNFIDVYLQINPPLGRQ